jgi:hypothetical protein
LIGLDVAFISSMYDPLYVNRSYCAEFHSPNQKYLTTQLRIYISSPNNSNLYCHCYIYPIIILSENNKDGASVV